MLWTNAKKRKDHLNKLPLTTIFYKTNFDCDTKWSWIFWNTNTRPNNLFFRVRSTQKRSNGCSCQWRILWYCTCFWRFACEHVSGAKCNGNSPNVLRKSWGAGRGGGLEEESKGREETFSGARALRLSSKTRKTRSVWKDAILKGKKRVSFTSVPSSRCLHSSGG